MDKLAIDGGIPVRTEPFPVYRAIGEEEESAAIAVIREGVLSKFLGAWTPDFFGGPQVQALEREWEDYFHVAHAVTVNSATSGLYAAIGASGVGPGDEVIVSPYTMSASAACILGYNAVPVFADVDPATFCITASTISKVLSKRTKAIVVVDLFGQPADFDPILELAKERKLVVIEDAAQAPGALYNGCQAGTLADMGVYSLNYHKIIHTGEGGVIVTNNKMYYERIQLIRNHAENVIDQRGYNDLVNMLGFNYRMTEIEAAIGRQQLRKLEKLTNERCEKASYLNEGLKYISGISIPYTTENVRHGYYVYAMKFDRNKIGVDRKTFAEAVRAEGISINEGYVRPIYLQSIYQKKILYGGTGCPYTCPHYLGRVSYEKGICPITEKLNEEELLYGDWCHAGMKRTDLYDIIKALHKVTVTLNRMKSSLQTSVHNKSRKQ